MDHDQHNYTTQIYNTTKKYSQNTTEELHNTMTQHDQINYTTILTIHTTALRYYTTHPNDYTTKLHNTTKLITQHHQILTH
jgi:hypothetical protein